MRNTYVIGLAVLCAAFLVLFTCPQTLLASDSYVQVTLKDQTKINFDYGTFDLNWKEMKVKEELTCKISDIDPSILKEIHVVSIGENFCDKKDDWLFDVDTEDGKSVQGFVPLEDDRVQGKLLDGGADKTVPFSEIEKISFFR